MPSSSLYLDDFAIDGLPLAQDQKIQELQGMSDWDIAIRLHEWKEISFLKEVYPELKKLSVQLILKKAKILMGSITRPMKTFYAPYEDIPENAQRIELDLETFIEEKLGKQVLSFTHSYELKKKEPFVIAVDTSLSMTGEKLILTAIALAIILLQFPEDPIGLVAFEGEATVLKTPEQTMSVSDLLSLFLEVPAQGYTHLESGVLEAIRMRERMKGPRVPVLLLTDGKYTAGRDPSYLKNRLVPLHLLKLGSDKSSQELCEHWVKLGKGTLKQVDHLEKLPEAMFQMVKDLIRSRVVS